MLAKLIRRFKAVWVLEALSMIKRMAARVFDFMPYAPLLNITGQSTMSVPLYWNGDGLPIGMQFAGCYGDEATLFQLAGQLERAHPWFDRLQGARRQAIAPT